MCGGSAVPSPGLLAAVRSRSGGPVGRVGECPTAHNRHPVVSRLPVWIATGCHASIRRPGVSPPPLPWGRWAEGPEGVGQQCTSSPASRNTCPASEGHPAQDRSAPRSFHGRGMRAASGQEDAWDGGGLSCPSRPSRRRTAFPCNAPLTPDVRPGKFAFNVQFAARAAKLAAGHKIIHRHGHPAARRRGSQSALSSIRGSAFRLQLPPQPGRQRREALRHLVVLHRNGDGLP
jgi:hypothetical protein